MLQYEINIKKTPKQAAQATQTQTTQTQFGQYIEMSDIETEILTADEEANTEISVRGDVLPNILYILPLIERPFFPGQVQPLIAEEDYWADALMKVFESDVMLIGTVLTTKDSYADITVDDFYKVGTVVSLQNVKRIQNTIQVVGEGLRRFKVVKWLSTEAPFAAQVEYIEPSHEQSKEISAYVLTVLNTVKEMMPLSVVHSEEVSSFLSRFNPRQAELLADFAASMTVASKHELQDILETFPILERLEKVLLLVHKEMEMMKLQAKIHRKVEEKMTEQQRQFFLREQLKAIQKELGIEKDDKTTEREIFLDRLDKLTVPDATMKRINEELAKFDVLEVGSAEYNVSRTYLDWITALPWGVHSKDNLNLQRARRVLDRDHDSLDEVKDRFIEFLAVGALRGEVTGSIILLVGPPGVGKTSIGKSIADSLGRKFYRFSVGGMRDEAEIKGHRRTYIGAMPGKIIQAIKDVETANPVIMLDEIDKIGASYTGDPASALLEVLDPAQNSDFLDHYLDVRFDLSNVLFICTANQLDTIPGPLLDRMETIRLSGYITDEKIEIAKNHLWPKQLEQAQITRNQLRLKTSALRQIIEGYAREAGVRNLDKQLGRIVRKAAVKIVNGHDKPIIISKNNVQHYLGNPVFQKETLITGLGTVTGLAWTAMGGATLTIEASKVHTTSRGFKLTGNLGDVMQESANIAYSYITSNAQQFGAAESFFDDTFIHVHVPEGATPKDGPSAGVTMATALLSLVLNKPIDRRLAMTGELTLTGHVFAVGGIREKVIAARRSEIFELILPAPNKNDFDELPDYIKEGITVHFASRFDDVIKAVFGDVK